VVSVTLILFVALGWIALALLLLVALGRVALTLIVIDSLALDSTRCRWFALLSLGLQERGGRGVNAQLRLLLLRWGRRCRVGISDVGFESLSLGSYLCRWVRIAAAAPPLTDELSLCPTRRRWILRVTVGTNTSSLETYTSSRREKRGRHLTHCADLARFVVPIRGLILVVVESLRESPRQRWVGRRSARVKKEKRAKTNHDFRCASLS